MVVTNDAIVARPTFLRDAETIMHTCGDRIALQLRMKHSSAAEVCAHAQRLAGVAQESGARLFVNERFDIAHVTHATGVQLGARSIPVAAARAVTTMQIGYSAHGAVEAADAQRAGANFIVLGTIWPSATHEFECSAGVERIERTVAVVSCPVYAIGGVTPGRAPEAMRAGARGVAAITAVWDAASPVDAALEFLEAMQVTG